MKNIIIVFTAFLSTIGFLQNCKTTSKIASAEVSHLETHTLVAYGEKIYKRENCGDCHTQQIEKENLQLISLDGVGGKYPNSWLYYYLLDPESLNPQSKKLSYFELFQKTLSKDILSEIAEEEGKKKYVEDLWNNMNRQAQSLSGELTKQGITSKDNSEVLALIAFIQQIPSSNNKLKLDSLENIKYLEQQKIWDNIYLDSTSIILKVANDEANSEKGKQIFKSNCSPCHGMAGQGILCPNLTDDYWLHGSKKSEIARTIIYGVPEKGMIPWKSQLTPIAVGELISFISSIRGTNPKNAKAPQGKKE